MKRLFILWFILSTINFWSCSSIKYNKIYRYDDEFRGNFREYVRILVRPEDRHTEIGNARIIFERVEGIGGGFRDAYFVIMRAASSFRADKVGFLKSGESKFEIKLTDPVSELRMETDETVSTYISQDSTGTSVTTSTDTDTRTWVEEKFIIKIPDESVRAILETDEIVFRFYFGPVPVTYIISGKKLELIKEIIE
ncbi:MAG: hypothetical protein MUC93_06055 [Bacteroidales bacterium]|nr:hypothetical protein [Bacteroidales bacterium]